MRVRGTHITILKSVHTRTRIQSDPRCISFLQTGTRLTILTLIYIHNAPRNMQQSTLLSLSPTIAKYSFHSSYIFFIYLSVSTHRKRFSVGKKINPFSLICILLYLDISNSVAALKTFFSFLSFYSQLYNVTIINCYSYVYIYNLYMYICIVASFALRFFVLVVVVVVVVVYARCDAKPLLYIYMYNMYM